MDFFEAVEKRRSIRKFLQKPVAPELIERCFDSALIAPNSSNTQTWDFYWVKNQDIKNRLVAYCLSQSAARTAEELIVVTADPKNWKRSYQPLNDFVSSINAPKLVLDYYKRLVPLMYRWGLFNSLAVLKWVVSTLYGLKAPTMRGPNTKRELQLVATKSAALACENFVLAASA